MEIEHPDHKRVSDNANAMRVLLITQVLDQKHPILGFFVRWVLEFARQTKQVTVICLEEGTHHLPDNVTVYSLGKEKKQSRARYLYNFYRAVLKSLDEYDVVFVHMNPEYVILGAGIWRLFGKKIGLWYLHKHVGIRLRLAALFADIIFTASPESFRLKTRKVHVVGHGIDTDFFPDLKRESRETFNIVSVGRLSPSKGHEIAIAAVAALLKKGKKVSLTIVGGPAISSDKGYQEELEEQVKDLQLEEVVRFAGGVPHADLPAFLYAADVFVHTSDTGSLDKVALEAMASGLPVVSSNDAVCGLLADYPELHFVRGDVGRLTQALEHLMTIEAEKRDQLGSVLRNLVREKHSLPRLVQVVTTIYSEAS